MSKFISSTPTDKSPRCERRSGRQRHRLCVVRGGIPHRATVDARRLRARFDRAREIGWDQLLNGKKTVKTPQLRTSDSMDWWHGAVGAAVARVARPRLFHVPGVLMIEVQDRTVGDMLRERSDYVLSAVNTRRPGQPPFTRLVVQYPKLAGAQ